MKISDAILFAKNILKTAGISPAEQEAVWLMEHVLGKKISDSKLQLSIKQKKDYLDLIHKRAKRFPLQYLIGFVDFFDTKILVTNDVLIPRHETEEMVELAFNFLKNQQAKTLCADLGTGSGCIPVSLAKKLDNTLWFACDKSEDALNLAKKNAKKNSVSDKINFFIGNWFAAFPENIKFDFIISNPPYVEENSLLQPELAHEPDIALFSGKDGLDDYRLIISELPKKLRPNGIFIGEFGNGQADFLVKIAENYGFEDVKILNDLSGQKRFIKLKFRI